MTAPRILRQMVRVVGSFIFGPVCSFVHFRIYGPLSRFGLSLMLWSEKE